MSNLASSKFWSGLLPHPNQHITQINNSIKKIMIFSLLKSVKSDEEKYKINFYSEWKIYLEKVNITEFQQLREYLHEYFTYLLSITYCWIRTCHVPVYGFRHCWRGNFLSWSPPRMLPEGTHCYDVWLIILKVVMQVASPIFSPLEIYSHSFLTSFWLTLSSTSLNWFQLAEVRS